MTALDLLIALGIMITWGLNFAVTKIGLEAFPPMLLSALRFGLVALALGAFVRLPRDQWRGVFAVGLVLGFLHFAFMFTGLARVDAAVAAIAVQLQVPFAAALAACFLGDRIGWRRALGMLVAFGGVAIVAGAPQGASEPWYLAMIILAACFWAVSNVLIKGLGQIDPLALNTWVAIIATPLHLISSLVLESGHWASLTQADWRGWFAVLYQSVAVFGLGYWAWYKLVARYPVSLTMPFTLLVRVFGVLSGVFFLGEPFTLSLAVGGLVTLLGVAIIVLRRPRSAGIAGRS